MSKSKLKKQIDSEGEYVVEKIIDKIIKNGHLQYLVKWTGYSDRENTWEPLSNLQNCISLLKKHENSIMRNQAKDSKKKIAEKEKIPNNPINDINNTPTKNLVDLKKQNADKRSFFQTNETNNNKFLLNSKRQHSNNDKRSENLEFNRFQQEKNYLPIKLNKEKFENIPFNINSKFGKKSNINSNNWPAPNKKNINRNENEIQTSHKEENIMRGGLGKEKIVLDLCKNQNYKIDDDKYFLEDSNKYNEYNYQKKRSGMIGKDKALRIKSSRIVDGDSICLIEWQQPNSDEILLPSECTNEQLKIYDQYILLGYYEERMKFKSTFK
jgi:hypothetical protein